MSTPVPRPFAPAQRLQKLSGYAFDEVQKRVAALEAQGIKPTDFGVGDPTVPTPTLVRERLKTAVDERACSGYPAYEGDISYAPWPPG
jgi:LL-diaminopimelate aminotransferase